VTTVSEDLPHPRLSNPSFDTTYITHTESAMDSQGENDELYPIAVLIDELKVCWCRRYRGPYDMA
jgi:hypothetical protein